MKATAQIFLSYAREDEEKVENLTKNCRRRVQPLDEKDTLLELAKD